MDNREKAVLVFEEELAEISNSTVKSFVLECFDKLSPDYFWDGPASSTGKHHPRISNRKHGLVLHVKLTCWWAKKLYESLGTSFISRDVLIAACLLHDLQKFGTALNQDGTPTLPKYSSTHGTMLALQLEDVLENFVLLTEDSSKLSKIFENIIASVALHMGKWTENRISQKWSESEESRIVQLADYCASKKVVDKTERLENWVFPEEEK